MLKEKVYVSYIIQVLCFFLNIFFVLFTRLGLINPGSTDNSDSSAAGKRRFILWIPTFIQFTNYWIKIFEAWAFM